MTGRNEISKLESDRKKQYVRPLNLKVFSRHDVMVTLRTFVTFVGSAHAMAASELRRSVLVLDSHQSTATVRRIRTEVQNLISFK